MALLLYYTGDWYKWIANEILSNCNWNCYLLIKKRTDNVQEKSPEPPNQRCHKENYVPTKIISMLAKIKITFNTKLLIGKFIETLLMKNRCASDWYSLWCFFGTQTAGWPIIPCHILLKLFDWLTTRISNWGLNKI